MDPDSGQVDVAGGLENLAQPLALSHGILGV